MNLTVPNVMMAGVVGLGLFAVYRLVKTRTEDIESEGSEGEELVVLGDPLKLTANRYYRARLRVRDVGSPPFMSTSSRETIAGGMKALGFTDVQVFMGSSELPSNWPVSTTKGTGPNTRWVQGRWGQPSLSLPRPPDIEQIWITKPPSGAQHTVSGWEPKG